MLTAPPPVWNRIAIDPALPAGLAPQMGTNVKFLMALNGPFWRRAELGAGDADRRSGVADLARHRRPARRRRGAGRVLGRHRRRHLPRVDAARRAPRTTSPSCRRSTGASARASCARASWTGRRIPGSRRRTRSPRPARSRRRGRRSGRASAGCTSPASTPSYAFMGYMEGALNSGAAVARRIAVKDGVVKGEPGVSRQQPAAGARARRARRHVQGLRSRARASTTRQQARAERAAQAGRRRARRRRRRSRRRKAWRRRSSSTSRAAWTKTVAGQNGRKEPKIDDRAPRRARSRRAVRHLRARAPGRAGAARRLRVQPPPRRSRLPPDRPDGPARSRAGRSRRSPGSMPTAARRSARR